MDLISFAFNKTFKKSGWLDTFHVPRPSSVFFKRPKKLDKRRVGFKKCETSLRHLYVLERPQQCTCSTKTSSMPSLRASIRLAVDPEPHVEMETPRCFASLRRTLEDDVPRPPPRSPRSRQPGQHHSPEPS